MNLQFSCIQCGAASASPYLLDCEDYFLGKPFRVSYYKCEGCGLVQQTPVPADVTPFYENYPVHRKKSPLFRLVRTWVMRACYYNMRLMPKTGESTLLVDFGCGDGWFLDANRRQGVELAGYEVDQGLADHLSKELQLPIYANEGELLRNCGGRADVVTMHFVLEHITDINHTFEIVGKLLKPNGIFYFAVPNISSWEARIFGRKWHNLDAPRHISFPEARSIEQLSARWGFETIKHRGVPFPNGVAGSLPVVLFGRFRFSVFLLFLPIGILLSRIFPGGNTAYWLKRIGTGGPTDMFAD
jgi:SAM-dependent methyltransferase